MKVERLWAYILKDHNITLVSLLFLGLSVVLPADAQVDLPSSFRPSLEDWTRMRPTSFPASNESAYTQCERSANEDRNDLLTIDKCNLLFAKLSHPENFPFDEQCKVVEVWDGVVFDFMNGQINGHHGVTRRVQKNLGRLDRADLCHLGDGVYAYFFRGEPEKSCNNVGFVFTAQSLPLATPVVSASPPPAPPKKVLVCWKVPTGTKHGPDEFQYLRGVVLHSCNGDHDHYIPDHVYYSGSTMKSSGTREVCALR